MERAIGEIFDYEGEWYQCIESDMCEECSLTHTMCGSGAKSNIAFEIFGTCSKAIRADNKHAIFKKLEPVGDPYPLYVHRVQRYAGVTTPVVLPKEPFAYYNAINNTVDIEVKQQNKNEEDMETNEKTMPVPEGWEFDHLDERGNIVLKKKKELPKTWTECLHIVNEVELITDEDSSIDSFSIASEEANGCIYGSDTNFNLLPQGLGKPMLALFQLLVCRNAWWKQLGWKPDWTGRNEYYCITNYNGVIDTPTYSLQNTILAFPSEDIRDKFLDTFRDLIEEAKGLL